MTSNSKTKRIAPSALIALKAALIDVYWYKSDLRGFLTLCLNDSTILGRLNWEDYKRNIVSQLVDYLAQREDSYQEQLLHIMVEVAKMDDFSHLLRLENGQEKATKAKESVRGLRRQIEGLEKLLHEKKEVEQRRQEARQRQQKLTATNQALEQLTHEYIELVKSNNHQIRGYKLEKVLRTLFDVFDLDPRASFKNLGEQIDGAFTFENIDYLLEAKWENKPIAAIGLDSLAGKLSRKLDNTLGLYLSINGYSEDGVQAHSSGRRIRIWMDGADLMAVLEGRIDLIQLLTRKRRAAAQTGNIYLKIHEILESSD
jgi:vacuolar-type H+-ATPase subunit I/STV1